MGAFDPVANLLMFAQRPKMDLRAFLLGGTLAISLMTPSLGMACAVIVTQEPTSREKQQAAKQAVDDATAIIDGEVIQALRGNEPAIVRAWKVLKGPNQPTFKIGERTSCDLALTQQGERLRLILRGGPEVYFTNLDASNARYEDRLLKSDRRKDWPYRNGHSMTE